MITRQIAKEISSRAHDALKDVADDMELDVTPGRGTYDSETFTVKFTFKTGSADRNEFGRYAAGYGLEPTDFGSEFKSKGRLFRISGVAPRSPKRPILCEEVGTGRTFKFTPAGVRSLLGK